MKKIFSERFRLLLLLIVFTLSAWASAAEPAVVLLPPGWVAGQSSSDDLEEAVKGCFGGEPGQLPQQAMNRSFAMLGGIRDAELLQTYLRLSASLDGKKKRRLLDDQAAWLRDREERCQKAAAEYEGGTMASAAYGALYLSMTVARNKVLEQQLRDVTSTH